MADRRDRLVEDPWVPGGDLPAGVGRDANRHPLLTDRGQVVEHRHVVRVCRCAVERRGNSYAPGMADQLERTTNLLALLLETPGAADARRDRQPARAASTRPGTAAMRGAFERDKACCATSACRSRPRCSAARRPARRRTASIRDRYELPRPRPHRRRAAGAAGCRRRGADDRGGVRDVQARRRRRQLGADHRQPPAAGRCCPACARRDRRAGDGASSTTAASTATLQPYALLLREGFWYVIGHDLGHDEVRTYRVDRIEGRGRSRGAPGRVRAAGRLRPADRVPRGSEGARRGRARPRVVRIDRARPTFAIRELGADVGRSPARRRRRRGRGAVRQPGRVPLVAARSGASTPRCSGRRRCAPGSSGGCERWRAGHERPAAARAARRTGCAGCW